MDEQARKEADELRSQLDALRFLFKSPGWVLLVEQYELQIKARENAIGQGAIGSMEDMFRKNHEIGIKDGLRLALQIPMQVFLARREMYRKFLELERGEQNATRSENITEPATDSG